MYLDIFILIIILLGFFMGLKNGIFVEVIDIFTLVLNIIICKYCTPMVIEFLKIKSDDNNYFITYIVTFIVLYLVVKMLLCVISDIFKNQNKGIINRGLGGLVGLVKGLLMSVIIILVYNYATLVLPSLESYSKNSKSIEVFAEFTSNIEEYIPDVFNKKIDKLREDSSIDRYMNKLL